MAGGGSVFSTPQYVAVGGRRRRARFGALFERLELALDDERGRWFLWLPVLFGCGIAIYLTLPVEPPLPLAVAGVLVAIPLRIFLRLTALRLIVSSVLLMVSLGFLDAKLRAIYVDAPVLQKPLRYVQLTGWVERAENSDKRTRLTIRLISLERTPTAAMPRRVRISLRGKAHAEPPTAGTAIRLRATLMPPPEPSLPGGYDFARLFWFQGIGATGYAIDKPQVLEGEGVAARPWDLGISAAINGFRAGIGKRVAAVLSGNSGAIAQALIMGDRGEISQEATVALRNSGIYHVISISGLHMALTAGTSFWLVRALLALFPALALRFPIKVWAAVAALVVASGYLVISGGAVTAVRSYIMIAIMFIAIMLNRPALSLRNVAFSALVILAVMPESLTDAGFQMSFAATAALIAFYETGLYSKPPAWLPRAVGLPLVIVAQAALTSVVASVAVDPFGAYHFHRIATYSVLGNVLASPVEALLIMPMALMTLLVMPLGLEAWPLYVMDFGIRVMMVIAETVAALPGATIAVPAFRDAAMMLMVAGGLWLMIWVGRWRYWGLAAVGAGLALAPFTERPDIWIGGDGRLVGVRAKTGELAVADTRKGAFQLTSWLEADGDARTLKEARKGGPFTCDTQSCIALVKGRLVSHMQEPAALADDCNRAAILVASFAMQERCTGPRVLIDLVDLRVNGAHTVMIAGNNITVHTVAEGRGARPWVVRHYRRDVIPAVGETTSARDEDGAGQ